MINQVGPQKIHKESIELLFKGSWKAIPFNIVLAALLGLDLIYNQAPWWLVSLWFVAIVAMSLIRLMFCHLVIEKKIPVSISENSTIFIFVLLTFLIGSVWGSFYFLMLPYLTELHEFIVILVYGGMCAGSIASLSVYLPAYYAYILPMFLPVIVYNYALLGFDRIILATMFLLFIVMVIVSAKLNEKLLNKTFGLSKEKELLISKLKKASITDPLTDLYNRRHFQEVLQDEINRAKRNKHYIGLIFIDIDNFKLINDNFGHPFGDQFLVFFAKYLNDSFKRTNDIIFRLGGDEFVVLLINSPMNDLLKLSRQFRKEFNGTLMDQSKHAVLDKISLSMGIVSISFNASIDMEYAITSADHALYQAKKQGKNKIILRELE